MTDVSSVTLASISQRYYSFARQSEPSAMPQLDDVKVENSPGGFGSSTSGSMASGVGAIAVESAPDSGRGNLVDTYA